MGSTREQSRKDWACDNDRDLLKLGCLQRIADATEAMARRHAELMADLDMYKRMYKAAIERGDALERRNAGLRGYITRLKRRIANVEVDHAE